MEVPRFVVMPRAATPTMTTIRTATARRTLGEDTVNYAQLFDGFGQRFN